MLFSKTAVVFFEFRRGLLGGCGLKAFTVLGLWSGLDGGLLLPSLSLWEKKDPCCMRSLSQGFGLGSLGV